MKNFETVNHIVGKISKFSLDLVKAKINDFKFH